MQHSFRRDLIELTPRLRRFAYSLTNNRADADDLVQAACERALRNEDAFRVGTRMDSWMYRIIQNLWIDERRKAKTRGTSVNTDDVQLSDQGKAADEPEARMMLTQVRAAMDQLPDEQRSVLSLVAIEGLSYREVAQTLDMPIGTVMSRLSRARERLMKITNANGAAS